MCVNEKHPSLIVFPLENLQSALADLSVGDNGFSRWLQIPEMIELQEIKAMLYENIQAWYEGAKIQGKAETLIKLLEEQFDRVDEQTRSLIYQLDEDNLHACFQRFRTAQSVSDVIGPF